MRAYIGDDLAHAYKQPWIIQHRFAHANAVFTQLTRFPKQPGRVREHTNRNGSIVVRHATEATAG